MDGRTLLQIISKDEKAKQFWEKFSGKDILDELFKHPELLGMQDTKYTTATEEEKDFFVKCMFSVSTENGFKFEREERVFDSFYEKLGQYVKIILKQKLIASSRKYDRQSGKTNSSESFLDSLQMFDNRYA